LIDGTTRVRVPSGRLRSIAMPRLTWAGCTTAGLPPTSVNELFISELARSARTIAHPMRWVKLTLPPRPRARWLLITIRLSTRSFAGTARTLVAVGTARDASMFWTIRAATPRSVVVSADFSATGSLAAGAAALAGAGAVARGCAGAFVGVSALPSLFAAAGAAAGLAAVGLAAAARGSGEEAAPGASVPALAALCFAVAAVAWVGDAPSLSGR
jgi:hypothetical protein